MVFDDMNLAFYRGFMVDSTIAAFFSQSWGFMHNFQSVNYHISSVNAPLSVGKI